MRRHTGAALRIAFLIGLIMGLALAAYRHGVAVGTVQTEGMIGPPLYKCVELLGAKLERRTR